MKLIVGLGNPGTRFRGTRHNMGFAVLDELARRADQTFEPTAVEALIARWRLRDTMLAKPLTFVNASGEAVGGLVRYFKIDPPDLLVVVDEAQLPLGRTWARSFVGCGSGWDGETWGGISRTTCWPGSTTARRRRSSA
ncbi:MAG: hypothetical protein DMF89_22325 [Acidobacteria bacterium]|nr:MAG: hypothetical protein DMF89_22325 [Acidobacteriota bacterium]